MLVFLNGATAGRGSPAMRLSNDVVDVDFSCAARTHARCVVTE